MNNFCLNSDYQLAMSVTISA